MRCLACWFKPCRCRKTWLAIGTFLLFSWPAHAYVYPYQPRYYGQIAEEPVDLSQSDKQEHFLFSTGISLVSAEFLRSQHVENPEAWGIVAAFGAGLAKEMMDPQFSTGDLGADALGAAAGALLSVTIHL